MPRVIKPLTEKQLELLRTAFQPHAPIEDPKSFFGREEELAKIREALSEPGLQVVVYGTPGCGKTSLANVATSGCHRVKILCAANADFSKILDDTALAIQRLYPQTIQYDADKDTITKDGGTFPLGKLSSNMLLALVPSNTQLCIMLDELDQVKNADTVAAISELTKHIATNYQKVTLVMVGVSDTANDLLRGHASNFRHLLQIPLDRMGDTELLAILVRGQQVLNLSFSLEATQEILHLCEGMPYYLHLLAKHAARAALEAGASTIEMDDLTVGRRKAATDADEQLRTTYEHAIYCPEGKNTFQRVVWAIANLHANLNSAATITTEANNIQIAQTDEPLSPLEVNMALKSLTSSEKHCILTEKERWAFSFTSPLMKGYVRLLRLPA